MRSIVWPIDQKKEGRKESQRRLQLIGQLQTKDCRKRKEGRSKEATVNWPIATNLSQNKEGRKNPTGCSQFASCNQLIAKKQGRKEGRSKQAMVDWPIAFDCLINQLMAHKKGRKVARRLIGQLQLIV